jgi:hypothetical protein
MKRHAKYWNRSLLTILTALAVSSSGLAGSAKVRIVLVGDSTVTDNAGWILFGIFSCHG